MSQLTETSSYLSGLRERATTQLTNGIRSDLSRTSTSEAMGVLFKLASSPSTAGDALALLHELQVHQVELELQHEELRRSRVELENDLVRQEASVLAAAIASGEVAVTEETKIIERGHLRMDPLRHSVSWKGKDVSLTITLSATPPKEGTSNWLPTPQGGYHLVTRMYLPQPEALDGRYVLPPVERVEP